MDGFINLNKPAGMTSFDCVAKLRKILHTKKIGHAGTLDPEAVGVLPIAVGKATRLLEYVTAFTKEYLAEMTIGIQTTTQDAWGEVLQKIDSSHITESNLCHALPNFVGHIEQIPPMYSAIKVQGKKLYELARQNITIERAPRKVTVYDINMRDFIRGQFPKAKIQVVCSKGTYIRTLIEDIGKELSTTAHMSSLQRTRVGNFSLDNAVTLEMLPEYINNNQNHYLLSLDYPLQHLGKIYVNEAIAKRIRHGNAILLSDAENIIDTEENVYCVYQESNIIAIAKILQNTIKVQKVLQTEGETK